MRLKLTLGIAFAFCSTLAQAVICLPEPAELDRLDPWRAELEACMGAGDCVLEVTDRLDRKLAAAPGGVMLERLRQGQMAMSIDAEQRRKVLAEQYRRRPDLDDQERAWLLARLQGDDAALEALAEDLPWAGLDRLHWRPDLPAPELPEDQREAIFEDFVARCPEALPLLLPEMTSLAISRRWPVWADIRRTLLALPEPPWARMDSQLIWSGLQPDQADPGAQLVAEAEAVADRHSGAAGYWEYLVLGHQSARQNQAATEAAERARAIDPCAAVSMHAMSLRDAEGEWLQEGIDEFNQLLITCPVDLQRLWWWMGLRIEQPEMAGTEGLAIIRRALDEDALPTSARPLLQRFLAIDDLKNGASSDASWQLLAEDFERRLPLIERLRPEMRTWSILDLTDPAAAHVELAFEQGAVDRGSEWMARRSEVRQRHDADLPAELLELLDADDRKLNWLRARAEDRPGEAVILALEAHTVGPTEIKLEDAAEAWQQAGGTTETFERLLAAWQLDLPARWRGWQRFDEPLPELSLSDIEDHRWTLADFDGQRTLVNLWAVWCGPCREELPKVQALHERFADDPDIRVVTINLDPNDEIALRFMAENGYDFPVLLRGVEQDAFNQLALPRNWLVDGQAQRRWQQTGFNPEIARHWVEDAASLLEQLD